MYRGIKTFSCTNCGHQFKSHDVEYNMQPLSVPQRCPNCGSVRTMPGFWIEGMEINDSYKFIWQEIEKVERKKEERLRNLEEKKKANEKEELKRREKKRKHMSQKQKEAYDKKRVKKAAKRSKITTNNEPTHQEEIILLGPTWLPPGTPLSIDEEGM